MRDAMVLAMVLAWLFAGGPVLAQPAELVREMQLVDGTLPAAQQLITVLQGDSLRWRFTSKLAGEVHVHAYRLNVAVQPGQTAELAFTAHATGRFRVEWHAAGAAPGGHHAPPLATLEVRPR